jgi:hypothetical protein
MSRDETTSGEGAYGEVSVQLVERERDRADGCGSSSDPRPRVQYIWRPVERLRADLPPDFALRMECIGPDDHRQFGPCPDPPAFILQASLAGFAILSHERDMTDNQRHSYHAMRLMIQSGWRARELLEFRQFRGPVDLWAPSSVASGYSDVLPDEIGLDANGEGTRWSIDELIRVGRASAAEAGVVNPNQRTCIEWGLFAAARNRPIDVAHFSQADAIHYLRLILFDYGPRTAANRNPELVDRITERLLEAIWRHLNDTTEAFDRWLFHDFDNVIHQIAQRVSGQGPIPREAVRQVRIELAFRAYQYAGQCMDRVMRDFLVALPQRLSPSERAVFETFYLGRRWLGGLPLVLLHRHTSHIRHAIQNLLAESDESAAAGALLQLLYFLADTTRRRREADRIYQAQRRQRQDRSS